MHSDIPIPSYRKNIKFVAALEVILDIFNGIELELCSVFDLMNYLDIFLIPMCLMILSKTNIFW